MGIRHRFHVDANRLFLAAGATALAIVLLAVPATRRGRRRTLGIAVLIGVVTVWVPLDGYRTARSLPYIHDITTDTRNPPAFVAVAPLRADAPNPAAYPGEETAAQQREAYPDIQPLDFPLSPDAVYEAALATARDRGWDIVAAEPGEGRIEATATTFWFGFKDDLVIRITPRADGSRLDIRSKSRVGRSDIGKNAARIREFTAALAERLER
ncbi:MAG: DUF1499 domain-containing protein [Woeseiaceae bacterium]|nr:DUF1499 domain-containing protein [Woeseiaceae bacterium]